MHSVPIKNEKNKKKNSPSFGVNSLLVPQEKSLTNNFGSSNNYIDNNYQINHKKVETPIEFIKQKKKFFMQDFFDIKGTNDFISSKELSLKKIELNDEILIEEKKNKIKLNTKSISDKDNKYNIKESKKSNGNSIKSKKKRKRNSAICVHKHINIEDNNGKKNQILKSKLLLIIKLKESIKTKKVITIRIIIYL